MGWVKLALGLGIGIYSYRSVTRVNSLVKQIKVPNSSLLGRHPASQSQHLQHRDYKDAYKISLPPHYRLLKGTGSKEELFVQDFAKYFFTSKLFSRLEAPLIKLFTDRTNIFRLEDETKIIQMKAFKLKQGDSYLIWTVVARDTDEILMRWKCGNFQGTTWFHIPRHDNCLVFGSSFPQPYFQEDEFRSIPVKLYIDSRRHLPDDAPVGLKFRAGLVRGLTNIVTGVHVLYSKYLLLSTFNKVINEEKRRLEEES